MSENKCLMCGKKIENNIFTYCDNCWEKKSLFELIEPVSKEFLEECKECSELFKERVETAKTVGMIKEDIEYLVKDVDNSYRLLELYSDTICEENKNKLLEIAKRYNIEV